MNSNVTKATNLFAVNYAVNYATSFKMKLSQRFHRVFQNGYSIFML